MVEIRHPEWRKSHEPTRYPFAENATLKSGNDTILEETFLDAIFYPVGNSRRLYLSQIDVGHEEVTLYIGTPLNRLLASGNFEHLNPPNEIAFEDDFDRPAGVLVSEAERLAVFQSWSVGTHVFTPDVTEFATTVSVPTPEIGVRGILLEDGSFFAGDVWLVGDDGIVLREETVSVSAKPAGCDQGETEMVSVIRVDIVGDTLFRRRLCQPTDLFNTPRYIEQVTFIQGNTRFACVPDDIGDIKMLVGNHLAEDTVLRIRSTPDGIVIEAIGEQLNIGEL